MMLALAIEGDRNRERATIAMVTAFSIVIIIAIEETQGTKIFYKQGFVDAKTGKQTFVLETQPDSTRIWIKNKNSDK